LLKTPDGKVEVYFPEKDWTTHPIDQ